MADECVNAISVVHIPNTNRRVQRTADYVLPIKLKAVNAIGVTLEKGRGMIFNSVHATREVTMLVRRSDT